MKGPIWWKDSANPCLTYNEDGFFSQCPDGEGTIDGDDINECDLFGEANLCAGGVCLDRPREFACACERISLIC